MNTDHFSRSQSRACPHPRLPRGGRATGLPRLGLDGRRHLRADLALRGGGLGGQLGDRAALLVGAGGERSRLVVLSLLADVIDSVRRDVTISRTQGLRQPPPQ